MKNVRIRKTNDEQRLEIAKTIVNEKMRWMIEDLVDTEVRGYKDFYYNIEIKNVRSWIRIYNNMRVMRGYTPLDGHYYYWHCLK